MGTIIRLKDANFTNSNLPKLGDYGKLITDDMHAMQQMLSQSNYLDDSTGNGNNLVYIGTGSTPVDPAFNNGVLTLQMAGHRSKHIINTRQVLHREIVEHSYY
ncbi:hypothetical protein [Providencia sp. PROV279]|uniref:hypothetical protein n=1 Tax=Providencia sp. PROV279 TaxID=2936804 RepID=UPI00298F5F8D|nr:hypothetical protein [Providencia sp. PROV279]